MAENAAPVLLCGSTATPAGKEDVWKEYPVQIIRFQKIQDLVSSFYQLGFRKILIEGGQKIFTLFHQARLIDEYVLMIAPRLLTGKHFLNFLAGSEQSLAETDRYHVQPCLELDGDVIVRIHSTD